MRSHQNNANVPLRTWPSCACPQSLKILNSVQQNSQNTKPILPRHPPRLSIHVQKTAAALGLSAYWRAKPAKKPGAASSHGKTPSLAASNANAPASTTTEADRSATQLLQRYYAPLCQKSLRFPCKSLATLTKSTACKTQRPARLRVSPTRDVQLTDLATESQIGHTSHPFNSVACKLLLFR